MKYNDDFIDKNKKSIVAILLSIAVVSAGVTIALDDNENSSEEIVPIDDFKVEENNNQNKDRLIEVPNTCQSLDVETNILSKKEEEFDTQEYYETVFNEVCTIYHLTEEELDTICAVVCQESNGSGTSYTDASAVASVILNRSRCLEWVKDNGGSYSLFSILTAKGQFAAYYYNDYKKHLGRIDLPGYHAALDTFYSQEPTIDYTSFRSPQTQINVEYMQLEKDGNKYFTSKDNYSYISQEEYLESLNEEFSLKL